MTVLDSNRLMTTYVLYMCNSPDQRTFDDLGRVHANKYVKIPLKKVGVTSTSLAHAMELISLKPALRASGAPIEWISSPCLRRLGDSGEIVEAYDWDAEKIDNTVFKKNVEVCFGSQTEVNDGLYNGIEIPSSWYNSTVLESSLQTLGFLSLFFNQESVAMEVIDSIGSNYKCSARTAKRNSNPVTTKRVLWCDYGGKANLQGQHRAGEPVQNSMNEDIWTCKTCPGPECTLVKDAGGKLLDYQDFGDHSVTINGVQYLESTEFMEMAVFADVWINSGSETADFNETLYTLLEENYANIQNGWLPLTEIPAIKQKRVYDFYRRNYYAYKEEA